MLHLFGVLQGIGARLGFIVRMWVVGMAGVTGFVDGGTFLQLDFAFATIAAAGAAFA